MVRIARKLVLFAGGLAMVFAAACGGSDSSADDRPRTPDQVDVRLPERLLGLEVVSEDIAAHVEGVSGTYVDSVGLFSFREDDNLLRASLQVARFNPVAEVEQNQRFRNEIIGKLGTSVPRELRMEDTRVWLTSGNEQNVFAWFTDEGFFVLSVRQDYPFPRTMLRRLTELEIL